jgi:hypothetical protein
MNVGLTTKDHFHILMAQRRGWRRGTVEHSYMTRAARKLVWIIRGVPAMNWPA